MPEPVIRRADLSDLESVSVLFDLYRQFYQQAHDLAQATAFIRARMESSESVIILAQDTAGHAIGFCQLYPSFCSVDAAPIYVLYDLFVHPEARRTGTGRALLLAAEQHAKAHGIFRLDLTTAKDNRKAQALYESLGWVRDEVFFTYNRRIPG